MATDIKTLFTGAVSPKITGGAGSFDGPSTSTSWPGQSSLREQSGSPIVNYDTFVSEIPKEDTLPTQFETGIRKTGM